MNSEHLTVIHKKLPGEKDVIYQNEIIKKLCDKYYLIKNKDSFSKYSFRKRIDSTFELVEGLKENGIYFYRRTKEDLSENKEMINLASNDYLGFTKNPAIMRSGIEAIKNFGAASGSVPMLSGTTQLHKNLEKEIAAFTGYDSALTFSSGYAANYGLLTALLTQEDAVILDMSVHASIVDGCCNTNKIFFQHNDTESLKIALQKASGYKNKLVIVDGVYSMDGDIARLDNILTVARENKAWIMVDESHAIGVIGKNGKGTHSHFNIHEKADFITSSMGKALGGIGGFVAGSNELISFLELLSRPFIFSTSIPQNIAAQLLEAFKILRTDFSIHQKLLSNIHTFKSQIEYMGFEPTQSESSIIPLLIRQEEKLMNFCRAMHSAGIFVNPIFYPVVQKKKSRIRISITARLETGEINYALDQMETAAHRLDIFSTSHK